MADCGRRGFICGAGAAVLAAGVGSVVRSSSLPQAVMPPGARSFERFRRDCLACGVCMKACPSGLLRPAGLADYGWSGVTLPKVDFTQGACDPACQRCAEACPAGALRPSPAEGRPRLRIGVAETILTDCRMAKGEGCGMCKAACPREAISLALDAEAETLHPQVDRELCIGCGRCLLACPSDPKAIRILPVSVQDLAQNPPRDEFDDLDDFGDEEETNDNQEDLT